MPDIRAMCAIGRRGQLGLNGRMPWEGAKGPEYTADVHRFFELTRGQVILLGPQTYRSVPTSRSAMSSYCFACSRLFRKREVGWWLGEAAARIENSTTSNLRTRRRIGRHRRVMQQDAQLNPEAMSNLRPPAHST